MFEWDVDEWKLFIYSIYFLKLKTLFISYYFIKDAFELDKVSEAEKVSFESFIRLYNKSKTASFSTHIIVTVDL